MFYLKFPPISIPKSALKFSISVYIWLSTNDSPKSTLIFSQISLSISPKALFADAPRFALILSPFSLRF